MDGIGACTPSERAVRLPRASRPETTSLRSRPRTAPPVVLPQKPRRLATQSEELTVVHRLLLERAGAWALRRRATGATPLGRPESVGVCEFVPFGSRWRGLLE